MPKILLVDDSVSQRRDLRGIISGALPDWSLRECDAFFPAQAIIETEGDFDAAVVDLCLSLDSERMEGLDLLRVLRSRIPNCFRILVSGMKREWEIPNRSDVDAFVSLLISDRDRRAQLERALRRADERLRGTTSIAAWPR